MLFRTFKVSIARVAMSAALCLSVLGAAEPQAAPIPADAAVKAADVKGLTVSFYDFYPKDAAGIDSLDIAKNWIGGHEPIFTYALNLSTINVSPGAEMSVNSNNTTLGNFLLGEKEYAARSKSEKDIPKRLADPIGPRTIMVFSGFIQVKKAGTYKISIPCDDGDETSVGGVVVHARPHFGGMNVDPDSEENIGKAEFAEAGIYPIKVILWDRDPGGLGLHVFSDLDLKGERHANGHTLLTIMKAAEKQPVKPGEKPAVKAPAKKK